MGNWYSAFTFWEDDIPTGLDLGKDEYGGPFTILSKWKM